MCLCERGFENGRTTVCACSGKGTIQKHIILRTRHISATACFTINPRDESLDPLGTRIAFLFFHVPDVIITSFDSRGMRLGGANMSGYEAVEDPKKQLNDDVDSARSKEAEAKDPQASEDQISATDNMNHHKQSSAQPKSTSFCRRKGVILLALIACAVAVAVGIATIKPTSNRLRARQKSNTSILTPTIRGEFNHTGS